MSEKIGAPTLNVGVYDPATDSIVIEGVKYSGDFFRAFGKSALIGAVLLVGRSY